MKTHLIYRSRAMQWLSLSALAWACAPTLAQGGSASADVGAAYQRERAACFSQPSAEDRATCLRDDRKDCVARMQGQGSTSGSVAGGGILREKLTVVPAPK